MCTDFPGGRELAEQRWGERAALHVPAEMITGDGDFEAVRVRDASLSGAFIETRRPLRLMTRVALCPAGRTGMWLDGLVVRAEAEGCGLEWVDPGLHPVSALLSLRRDEAAPTARPDSSHNVSWQLLERLKG
jgi:hypothetical protein